MRYSNDKIKQLIEERDKQISYFNSEIEKEIQKEKAKYKISWKRLSLLLALIILPIVAYKINTKMFPKTSIWSWNYYIKK